MSPSIPELVEKIERASTGNSDSEPNDHTDSDAATTTTPTSGEPTGPVETDKSDGIDTDEIEAWWTDRPVSGSGCRMEPLDCDDNVVDTSETESPTVDPDEDTDFYGLSKRLSADPELVGDDRYLTDEGDAFTHDASVRSYLGRRKGEALSAEKHGFVNTRQNRDMRNYGRGKEMGRQVLDEFDNPTTALISLRPEPDDAGRLTLLDELDRSMDYVMYRLRQQLSGSVDAPLESDEWEYITVFAGTRIRATPHVHIYVWLDGNVKQEIFDPVVESFVNNCQYAPCDGRGNVPAEGAVSVRGNGDDEIPRMDDAPGESAGATYVLTQLPHLSNPNEMATDELLHGATVDAWGGNHFRRSEYEIADDETEDVVEKSYDNVVSSAEIHTPTGDGDGDGDHVEADTVDGIDPDRADPVGPDSPTPAPVGSGPTTATVSEATTPSPGG